MTSTQAHEQRRQETRWERFKALYESFLLTEAVDQLVKTWRDGRRPNEADCQRYQASIATVRPRIEEALEDECLDASSIYAFASAKQALNLMESVIAAIQNATLSAVVKAGAE